MPPNQIIVQPVKSDALPTLLGSPFSCFACSEEYKYYIKLQQRCMNEQCMQTTDTKYNMQKEERLDKFKKHYECIPD